MNQLKNKTGRALVLLALLSLSGCAAANNIGYRRDAAHPVRSVTIAKEVKVPERMLFVGFSQMMAMGVGGGLGGAVGGAIMGGTTTSRKPGADLGLGDSVRDALAAGIQKTRQFSIATAGVGDAELRIAVKGYGFYQAGFMRRQVRPVLTVQAQLVRRDGKVIWDQTKGVGPNDRQTEPLLPERMRNNPEIAASALRTAARIVAADLAATLRP